jgi:flavin reductase (DIM6/NTAB) family NADH-FMN oxidoreductase RutF
MEKIVHFNSEAIKNMEKRFRANFINSVTGFKSANLLGTKSEDGITNLAIFSSVTHLGSNPALLGFVTRPTVVPRHTYANIQATKKFTVNHINSAIIDKAHQTAARYEANQSEFEKTGLTEEYLDNFPAPFVKEAHVKIGCEYVNQYEIKENGTVLIVAAIQHIYLPEPSFTDDGWINLNRVQGVTINGLDSYSSPQLLDRFSYAKPEEAVSSILK